MDVRCSRRAAEPVKDACLERAEAIVLVHHSRPVAVGIVNVALAIKAHLLTRGRRPSSTHEPRECVLKVVGCGVSNTHLLPSRALRAIDESAGRVDGVRFARADIAFWLDEVDARTPSHHLEEVAERDDFRCVAAWKSNRGMEGEAMPAMRAAVARHK